MCPVKKKKLPRQRYAVVLEYDGSGFSGWQYQENAGTVQAALEKALWKLFREHCRVGGASRTDAGVHARGQVAIFNLAYPIEPRRLVAALNGVLPSAVRVLTAKKVSPDWDPRQKAVEKTYSYLIHNRPVASPLWLGKAWQIYPALDLKVMHQAARKLIGRHDFSAFRASGCEARSPVRNLKAITISRRHALIAFRFVADAFLYRMVRNLVGTLVEVGRGKIPVAEVKKILLARDRRKAGPTAPAYGLYLENIRF